MSEQLPTKDPTPSEQPPTTDPTLDAGPKAAELEQATATSPAPPGGGKRRLALHTRILLGMLVGIALGVIGNRIFAGSPALGAVQRYVSDPVGKIFLNLLIMVVIPLIFSSLILGVTQIGDVRRLGRMGLRAASYFLLVTTISVSIGLILVNAIRPGTYLPAATKDQLLAAYGQEAAAAKGTAGTVSFGIQTLIDIVPRNPFAAVAKPTPDMLALIFFSIIMGVAATLVRRERVAPFLRLLEGVYDITVKIIELAMRLAPYGVAALLFSVISRFGFELLYALGMYVATVLLGLGLHFFGVYSLLVRTLVRYPPLRFFRRIYTVILTAFSTSSSAATLPTTLMVTQEELGVPASICGFVLPLGATMNMNGTALFEGVTVVFLAQVFGVDLPASAQVVVVVMSVLMAVGTAAVPAGSLPLIIIVLQMVHVPAEGIAIIFGVDRLLDMCRTTLNVVGDVTCAAYIARSEGVELRR